YSTPCIFFFQAEDGIRDRNVTGVQTCALPIWSIAPGNERRARRLWFFRKGEIAMKYITMILDSFSSRAAAQTALEDACVARWGRSEERRVGKERRVRSRRWEQDERKDERRTPQ